MNVAGRYAKSIFELATEKKVIKAIAEDMQQIAATIADSKDLKNTLNNPLITKSQKMDVLNKVFKSTNELTQNLMRVMSSKKREGILGEVATTFLSLKNKSEGITEVSVITAKEVKAEDLKGIEAFVKSNTDAKKVLISSSVDASLIGGFKVTFDGKLYDSTVSTQLNNLKKELKLA